MRHSLSGHELYALGTLFLFRRELYSDLIPLRIPLKKRLFQAPIIYANTRFIRIKATLFESYDL